ncbi:MAG: hypothetical protein R2682_05310 [Pyrinomonadaceae bacterium]
MNGILGLAITLIFLAHSCLTGLNTNAHDNGNASPPAVVDVDPAEPSEEVLVHIAQERLLRSAVEIDSTVHLGDRTFDLELDSFPKPVSEPLVSAFRQANAARNVVHPPFDVYAKIVPVTYSDAADDLTKVDKQNDRNTRFLVLLSGTGIVYREGKGNHFERDPVELFGCARFAPDTRQERLLCLYTSYDADTNVFKDVLFEQDSDGKWTIR